jgi:hypothetical protein
MTLQSTVSRFASKPHVVIPDARLIAQVIAIDYFNGDSLPAGAMNVGVNRSPLRLKL